MTKTICDYCKHDIDDPGGTRDPIVLRCEPWYLTIQMGKGGGSSFDLCLACQHRLIREAIDRELP